MIVAIIGIVFTLAIAVGPVMSDVEILVTFQIDSARFGLVGGFKALRDIKKGEQIFSNYGYPLNGNNPHLQWYYDEWHEFVKNFPNNHLVQQWLNMNKDS